MEHEKGERLIVTAHTASYVGEAPSHVLDRHAREDAEDALLAPGATRARGAGARAVPEDPDPMRTCFERDLDRIHHSAPFRRLAGKCQVFIAPDDDHLRTRLTHAIEVAQVAVSIARATGLNVALTAAAATGHDCGHGPAGHASEGALSPYLDHGYHHAVYGADIVLSPLNLCAETLDAVRNHSWNRPAPTTPEGEVVSWADRIAYVCHDFEDAVAAGVVTTDQLPPLVRDRIGVDRSAQLGTLIRAMIEATADTGRIGMTSYYAEALAEFRRFNYEEVYLRPASKAQANSVIAMLRALVERYAAQPVLLPDGDELSPSSPAALRTAVGYVGGMTDRFACRQAMALLDWERDRLPVGIDV